MTLCHLDWEFTGVGSAGDYADVYAYLLNTADGSTAELTDYTHNASGGTGTISVSETLGAGIDGLYKFVFVSGAHDNDGGTIVGSEVIVSNLSVTDTGGDLKTLVSTTPEAQESSAVSITRSLLAVLTQPPAVMVTQVATRLVAWMPVIFLLTKQQAM